MRVFDTYIFNIAPKIKIKDTTDKQFKKMKKNIIKSGFSNKNMILKIE